MRFARSGGPPFVDTCPAQQAGVLPHISRGCSRRSPRITLQRKRRRGAGSTAHRWTDSPPHSESTHMTWSWDLSHCTPAKRLNMCLQFVISLVGFFTGTRLTFETMPNIQKSKSAKSVPGNLRSASWTSGCFHEVALSGCSRTKIRPASSWMRMIRRLNSWRTIDATRRCSRRCRGI